MDTRTLTTTTHYRVLLDPIEPLAKVKGSQTRSFTALIFKRHPAFSAATSAFEIMAQNYKISINKAFLWLCGNQGPEIQPGVSNPHKYINLVLPADKSGWLMLVSELLMAKARHYLVSGAEAQQSYTALKSTLLYLEAAGGLVRNGFGEYLLIHRYGHWDLPKGKIEELESPEEAAIREVEEECGISLLRLMGKIAPYPWPQEGTLHIFQSGTGYALKLTHWYNMLTPGRPVLVPQKSEGIEAARWVAPQELPTLVSGAYPNIADLLTGIGSQAE